MSLLPILLLGGGLIYLATRPGTGAPADVKPRTAPAAGSPTEAQCEGAYNALPADAKAKVKGWVDADLASGGTSNIKMAASYLELAASTAAEPAKSNMLLLARCLRGKAAADGPKPATGTPPSMSGADCATVLAAIAKMNPTYGPVIASKDPAQLKALAAQLAMWLPAVSDPTVRANVEKGIKCLNDLAASGGSSGGAGSSGSGDCLTDDDGNVIADGGLANLLAHSPKLATAFAGITGDATKLANLAQLLKNSCQGKAADEVDGMAKSLGGGIGI